MTVKNVILDLDQTIISGEIFEKFVKDAEEFDQRYYDRDKQVDFKYVDMDKDYVIYERPHLQEFLDWLFKNYNVSVWTAASKNYAMFIIEKIILKKKNRRLDYVFFCYHCDISIELTDNTKDLSILWKKYKLKGYNKNNTIIIDDYDEVYNTQPKNCIQIIPFKFIKKGSENDDELIKIKEVIKSM